MGKARREEKLRKREQQDSQKSAATAPGFSWKRYFQLLGRTLPRVILLFVATMAVYYVLLSFKISFFATGLGQILLFTPMYIMVFIWTQGVAKEMRSSPPPKSDPNKPR